MAGARRARELSRGRPAQRHAPLRKVGRHLRGHAPPLTSNASTNALASQGVFYAVTAGGGWAHDIPPVNCTQDANGRLTAGIAQRYETICTVAFTSAAAPNRLVFQLFKNGNPLSEHVAVTWTDTATYPNTVTITGLDDLVPGDVIDLRVACTTAADVTILVTDCNFAIKAGV